MAVNPAPPPARARSPRARGLPGARARAGLAVAAAALVVAVGARAQGDLSAALTGATEVFAAVENPGRWRAPLRPFDAAAPFETTLEGRLRLRALRLPDGPSLAAFRRLEAALAGAGYQTVLSCGGAACGGFDFRAALQTLPPPAMRVDLRDFHHLTARRDASWVAALVSRAAGALHVQIVEIADARPADRPEASAGAATGGRDAGPAASAVAPASAADARQLATAADARQLAAPAAPDATAAGAAGTNAAAPAETGPAALLAALARDGRATLTGVDFAAGARALTEGSAAALDMAAAALRARPDLRVAVVGHTDGQGPLAVNLSVSIGRAELVRAALAARGVDPARLEAHGAGWLAPAATNATPEGRAANRRVDLVLR